MALFSNHHPIWPIGDHDSSPLSERVVCPVNKTVFENLPDWLYLTSCSIKSWYLVRRWIGFKRYADNGRAWLSLFWHDWKNGSTDGPVELRSERLTKPPVTVKKISGPCLGLTFGKNSVLDRLKFVDPWLKECITTQNSSQFFWFFRISAINGINFKIIRIF